MTDTIKLTLTAQTTNGKENKRKNRLTFPTVNATMLLQLGIKTEKGATSLWLKKSLWKMPEKLMKHC
ncbi:MAG TPA: hypothetical protein PLP33_24680 [Leptospiraceae bacterium]|nr:hypothetical protein [Leptospiraceae bacterium]